MLTHDEIVKKLADKLRKEVPGLLVGQAEEIAEKILPTVRHLVVDAIGEVNNAVATDLEAKSIIPPYTTMLMTGTDVVREYGPLTADL